MRYHFIVLSIFFVFGCVPYSDTPLSLPDKEQIDTSILGTWFWKDEKESGYIHIGLEEKTKLLRVVMVEYEKDGEIEVSEFSGHTSLLEGKRYLNLKWVRPIQDSVTGYMVIKYQVSPLSLGIALMDATAVETAIKSGSVKGKVVRGHMVRSISITEDQEKLRIFVLRGDAQLFPEMNFVKKLKFSDPGK
jgi:hypothetical protein